MKNLWIVSILGCLLNTVILHTSDEARQQVLDSHRLLNLQEQEALQRYLLADQQNQALVYMVRSRLFPVEDESGYQADDEREDVKAQSDMVSSRSNSDAFSKNSDNDHTPLGMHRVAKVSSGLDRANSGLLTEEALRRFDRFHQDGSESS